MQKDLKKPLMPNSLLGNKMLIATVQLYIPMLSPNKSNSSLSYKYLASLGSEVKDAKTRKPTRAEPQTPSRQQSTAFLWLGAPLINGCHTT